MPRIRCPGDILSREGWGGGGGGEKAMPTTPVVKEVRLGPKDNKTALTSSKHFIFNLNRLVDIL